ncbi:hypothetical protein NJ7G_3441 [Natrinema sp. J7-2]|nr:hypothetical protein NJ7G_3441 [Natrinema sp. J7-2]
MCPCVIEYVTRSNEKSNPKNKENYINGPTGAHTRTDAENKADK